MEFKRDSVIALYWTEKPQVAIVRALQHVNVNKSFVSLTIARYRDTDSNASRSKKIARELNNRENGCNTY